MVRHPGKRRSLADHAGGAGSVITDPCPKCKGEGRVLRQRTVDAKVPAGVEDGTRIRFSGLGEAGAHGGPAGDLYVVLHVKEHPFFEREGNDLHCVIPVSFTQAALGTEIRVPTLDGEQTLKVPDGTQSGTTLRIRGKGVPLLNGHGKGNCSSRVAWKLPASSISVNVSCCRNWKGWREWKISLSAGRCWAK